MRKTLLMLLTSVAALLFAAAQAQDFHIGDEEAGIGQSVDVEVPPRYGLHLTNTDWDLAMGSLDETDECYLVPKGVPGGWPELKGLMMDWYDGTLAYDQTILYPGLIATGGTVDIENGEYAKGSVICYNLKILQKFTNVDDWQLHLEFDASSAGYGRFVLFDYLDEEIILDVFERETEDFQFADVAGTTGGWQDDIITEAFWFDGSELAGDYDVTLTFTLTTQ